MNTQQALKMALDSLASAPHEARWIVSHYLAIPINQLLLRGDQTITLAEQTAISKALNRRKQGEPLQYILGEQPFMDFTIKVTPDVLIPRWDSEVVVEAALNFLPQATPLKVGDVCTGSGVLALAIKYYRPKAQVWAVDISPKALAVAKTNALNLGLDIKFGLGDLLAPLKDQNDYDLIISNPPYIPSEVVATLADEVLQEPHLALDGGMDGLDFYHRLAQEVAPKLKPGGCLIVEIGHDQGEAVSLIFKQAGFKQVEWGSDYGHNQRFVYGFK